MFSGLFLFVIYWAGVFTAPMVFTSLVDHVVRKPFILFLVGTSALMIAGTWGLQH